MDERERHAGTGPNVAGLLIDALTDSFDPTEYSDGYVRTFKGLINDKIEGKAITPVAPAAAPVADPKVDVMAMLWPRPWLHQRLPR